jgi:hypothetical protein
MQIGEVAMTFPRVMGVASRRANQTSIFSEMYRLICLIVEKVRRDRFDGADGHGT